MAAVFAALAGWGCAAARARPSAKAIEFQAAGARSLAHGDFDRAAGQFSLALDYDPKMAEARNGLGLVALARGDRETALAQLRKALALDEELAEAHLNVGFLMLDRRETEEALRHFRKALAIDPGFGAARLATGETLLRLGRTEEARWELAKLCELEPKRASAHAAHALVLARLGRMAAAEDSARRSLALDPALPAAHRARADILRRRGDFAGAAEEIAVVLRAEPSSVDDRLSLSATLVALGRDDDADHELARLERTAPTRAEIAFARAFMALRRERTAEAVESARRALSLRAPYPEARLVLAEALLRAGAQDEGRGELKRFLAEAPPTMALERRRAEAYLGGEPLR